MALFRLRLPAPRLPALVRYRSSATPLSAVYTALIVYASLYPFTGWRLGSTPLLDFVSRSWPAYWTAFDLLANWLGYAPLGLLLFIACIRHGWRVRTAWVVTVLLGSGLSFTLEFLQNFLPHRVPSNVDWLLNTAGVLLGLGAGTLLQGLGGIERWQTVRERWFVQPSAGGIALLLLWPVGLLFPLPLPFAMGQVLERARDGLLDWLSDTPLAPWSAVWLAPGAHHALTPTGEFLLICLGLLSPFCLVLTITHPGWRRLALLLLTTCVGGLAMCLSMALSFGPEHALVWATPKAVWASVVAFMLALILSSVSRRSAAAMGLMILTGLVAMITQAPADPYFAQNLQSWEQGRFIRFHGASQWIGWLWPYLSIAYLMSAVAGRYPQRAVRLSQEPEDADGQAAS